MEQSDVIVAIASAPGRGGHAIVRASGPGALAALRALSNVPEHLAPSANGDAECVRAALNVLLHIDGMPPFPARALVFPRHASFTGEDSFELHIPGGTLVASRVIAALTAVEISGIRIRLAHAGEFAARAYLNGRLSPADAERLPALIAAQSSDELHAAQTAVSPERAAMYRSWADELTRLLALVESGIDFVDQEDVRPISPGELAAALAAVQASMDRLRGRGSAGLRSSDPVVVIAGRPSSGKSTLFNALLRRARSMTAPEPGTTRDAIAEVLEFAGTKAHVVLTDLPGLDDSGQAFAPAQDAAANAFQRADLVLWCDPAAGRTETPPAHPRRTLLVRTKADRPHPPVSGWLEVCALDGRGLDALRAAILRSLQEFGCAGAGSILPRHARVLAAAAMATSRAMPNPKSARLDDLELVAEHLRGALNELGALTGPVRPDDVLARIFSSFCIGK